MTKDRSVASGSGNGVRIAVLIPCLNEEMTIGKVIEDVRCALPQAKIIVGDNGSTDRSAEIARAAGVSVIAENRRGKGHICQAMFQNVDADLYVMIDGDDTYPAEKIHDIIRPVLNGDADMSVGSRIAKGSESEFRLLNLWGNKLCQCLINLFFRTRLTDILSGFRAMNRKVVQGLPLFVPGFEIEAELTIKALERGYRIAEVPVSLRNRPAGSSSKIRIVRDGVRIVGMILQLFRDYKPLTFFGGMGLLLLAGGLALGCYSYTNADVGQQPMVMSELIFSLILFIGGLLCTAVGLLLHTIDRRFQEMEYYLRVFQHPRPVLLPGRDKEQ